MEIIKAIGEDCKILTELTKTSKAYWGYSEEQIQQWNVFLTITKEYIETNSVYKLIEKGIIVGYYSYFSSDKTTVTLDNLFLMPNYIRKGLGKLLMNDFINRIKSENYNRIILNSEPHAEYFYQKIGFIKIGEFETSIKNRFMPIMEMNLE